MLPIAMEMQRRGIGEMRIKLTEKGTAVFELLNALKNSLDPCFAHLEETLLEGDGKVLDIRITVKAGKIKLEYGVGDLVPLTRCSIFSSFNA